MQKFSGKDQPTVVTSGVDAEYCLHDLSVKLRDRGFDVVEIDFGRIRDSVTPLLHRLAARKTVYITSAHTALTVRSAERLAPTFPRLYPNYLAPIEIIPILKPTMSMYVPHDLLTPFGDDNLNERCFLDLYDHILAPEPSPELQAELGPATRVHTAGWIKYNSFSVEPPEGTDSWVKEKRSGKSLFISMIQHLLGKYGPAGFADYLGPIIEPGMNVKLPAWKGIEPFERLLVERFGVHLIPAAVNSIELIQRSDIVVCNTVSSILAESVLLGIPTVALLDDEGISGTEKQRKMEAYPEVVWHDYRSRSPFPDGYLAELASLPKKPRLQLFDCEPVVSLLCAA